MSLDPLTEALTALESVRYDRDELKARLAEVERERDDWKSATLECDCDYGCGCFVRHCPPGDPCTRHALVDSRDAEKARADRAEAALRCPDETYDHVHRCVRCDSEVTP